jgi:cyclophilin family peptidyl-prolyl cis-trans isomerase
MAIEKKIFAGGGMDMDTDERFMPKTDYKKAVNCRISKTDEGNDGIVENIRSNHLTNNTYIQEGDKCIGTYEDKSTATVIFFIYAFDGNHGIYRKKSSGSMEKIVQDPILNFHQRYLITGINVVGSDEDKFPEGLLYWTDDYNPPRKINIEKARTGGYSAITEDVIDAIKWAPDLQPRVAPYLTDSNVESNQLKGKAWQFKYRWIYDDGEKSSWSPISKIINNNSFDSFFNSGLNSYLDNVIPVGFLAGQETVERIQIAARNTNGADDFILICDIDKNNVKEKVGNTKSSITTVYNSTNPIPNGNGSYRYFYFYNDSIYSTIDVVESNKLYNDVPHLAKAQEIVDGNRLVYGNVVSGQTGLEELDISLAANHPSTSSVDSNPPTVINLSESHRARMKFTDEDGDLVGTKDWYTTSTFWVRWKIPETDVSCLSQYRIDLNGLKAMKFCTRNWYSAPLNTFNDADVLLIDVDFVSSSYTGQSALSIANDIASDISTQTSALDIEEIKAKSPADAWWNFGGFLNNNYGTVKSSVRSTVWSSYASGNDAYVEVKINMHEGSEKFKTYDTNNVCGISSSPGSSNNETTQTSWSSGDVTENGIANDQSGCAARAKVTWRIGIGYDNYSGGSGHIDNSGNIHCWTQSFFAALTAQSFDYATGNNTRINRWLSDRANNDNVDDSTSIVACVSSSDPAPLIMSSFKTGAKHRFGLVYYDHGNRSTSVQLAHVSDIYIPKITESLYTGEWEVAWEINHNPPDWATHYQWVYGGNTLTDNFLQFVTGGFYAGDHFYKVNNNDNLSDGSLRYTNNILVDITNIKNHQELEGGTHHYEWKEGDMLRFILDGDVFIASPSPESYEFKILGIAGERDFPAIDFAYTPAAPQVSANIFAEEGREYLILANESAISSQIDLTTASLPLFENYTLEIYSPKKVSDEDNIIYYEFGEFGNINEDNGILKHDRVIGDTTSVSQTVGNPATGTFKRGDIYYRLRASKSPKFLTPVESFHYSDIFKSDYWDKGRPNAVLEDFKRTRKHSTCLYSESYIPNTNINGLSSFFPDVSFQEFERDYNSIQKLHSKDNKLIIFQEDKVSQSLVNRNIIYNIDGSGNVATSDSVLSQAVPYLGNYGINKNPESFAVYGNRMYFVDIQRGVVLRLGNDGFTPISNYKMKNFFTDSFKAIQSLRGDNFHKIVGVYDSAFDEYVISQPGHWSYKAIQDKNGNIIYVKDNHLIEAYTVGFCESSNRWNSFYSYIPEMMCPFQNGFVSFDGGNLYVHNISGRYVDGQNNVKTYNTYNKFYGIEYDSELWVVSNEAPSNNKVYQSFSQESDKIWDVTFDSPNGQSTALLPSDFDTRENIHYSDIMNDVNSAGGLIEGDRIRDVTLLAKLKLFSNKLTRIFGVNFNFAPSQRSNK